jgi:hypothetical protein
MTSESWSDLEALAFKTGRLTVPTHNDYATCILELRARVEALELGAGIHNAVTQELRRSFPGKSLVERVEGALLESVKEQGSMARAAIREVAEWLDENTGGDAAWMLTQEAER